VAWRCPLSRRRKTINIISDESNADALAILRKIADDFGKQAGVKVVVNNMDHEAHKTAIRNYLRRRRSRHLLLVFGNRMRAFVKRGLFDDISDLFEKEKYKDVLGAAAGAVTVDGKQYACRPAERSGECSIARTSSASSAYRRRQTGRLPRLRGQVQERQPDSDRHGHKGNCGPPPAGSTR